MSTPPWQPPPGDPSRVVPGPVHAEVRGDLVVTRLNPNLSLDSSFGTNGCARTSSGDRNDLTLRVSASRSRIVAAGVSASTSGTSFVVNRYFK